MPDSLDRFSQAHQKFFLSAIQELQNGNKKKHWMWFIFPQLRGLGYSEISNFYGLENIDEAVRFSNHPVLGTNLVKICRVLLDKENQSASDIFGYPDVLKLHSSLTLFSIADRQNTLFSELLEKYFNGKPDQKTLELL